MNLQIIFETALKTNLVNFLIMIGLLVWIFKHFHLGIIVDSLSDSIKNDYESNVSALEKAVKDYKEIKKETKQTPLKKEKILDDAKILIKNSNSKHKEKLEEDIKKLDSNFEKSKITLLNKQIKNTTKTIENVIFDISGDTIKNMLDNAMQEKLILNSLDELEHNESEIIL